jgi:hypothetical protein
MASKSIIGLFRSIHPELLPKKERVRKFVFFAFCGDSELLGMGEISLNIFFDSAVLKKKRDQFYFALDFLSLNILG